MANDGVLEANFAVLKPLPEERLWRIWAGVEACAIGQGGLTQVARATGLSSTTLGSGVREIQAGGTGSRAGEPEPLGRLRRAGAGRKALSDNSPACWQLRSRNWNR